MAMLVQGDKGTCLNQLSAGLADLDALGRMQYYRGKSHCVDTGCARGGRLL